MAIYIKIIEDGILKKYIPGYSTTSLIIPDNVHTIANSCCDPHDPKLDFDDVSFEVDNWEDYFMVKTISIPSNIKHVEKLAFIRIPNLKKFIVDEECSAVKTYDDVLFTKDGETLLCCPAKKEGDFTVPYGVKTILENSFEMSKLLHIFIPNSVTVIEDDAFSCCTSLEEIYIPSTVTSIGERAFEKCCSLTVIAPENSYAVAYAKKNNIPYKTLDESVINEKTAITKTTYWACFVTQTGTKYRDKKLGYAYEWNGSIFYSDVQTPTKLTQVTEKNSGIMIDFGKLFDKFSSDAEAMHTLLNRYNDVMELPTDTNE